MTLHIANKKNVFVMIAIYTVFLYDYTNLHANNLIFKTILKNCMYFCSFSYCCGKAENLYLCLAWYGNLSSDMLRMQHLQ